MGEVEEKVKEAAEISMGTEISEEDITNIKHLCEQVIEIQEYRGQLYEYLKTKHDTPKYGLIYHAQLVGQASSKMKGKVSRMLAAKAALACRVDALGDETNTDLGIEHRAKVESRIRQLEGGVATKISGTAKQGAKFDKYESKSEVVEYKAAADVTIPKKRSVDESDDDEKPATKKIKVEDVGGGEKKKKKKKEKKEEEMEVEAEPVAEVKSEKKKKKKDKEAVEEADTTADSTIDTSVVEEGGEKKKKKKKKKEADD